MTRTETIGEEIANSITHGLGAVLSVVGLIVLAVLAYLHGSRLQVVVCATYGMTLVLLYTSSTLYHALTAERAKRVFRVLDHSAIYLLIAGTYTPFLLVTLRGTLGWILFGVIWTLAALGILFKCFFTGRLHALSTTVYILMGWLAIVAVRPLWNALAWQGFAWLVAGGIAYTAGVVFFASHWKFSHAVWHLFVLMGSACHFVAVYRCILRSPVH